MKGSWTLELFRILLWLWKILHTSSHYVLCFHCLDLQTLRNRNDTLRGERQTLWCFLLSSKRNLLSLCCSLWTLWLTHSHEVSQVWLMPCQRGHILTPADEKEDPLSKLISWISHDNGRMKVTTFHKHPEKVCHHKVVVYGCNQTTPRLKKKRHGSSLLVNGKRITSLVWDWWSTPHYLVALVDIVVDQLKQEPHNIPQYEGGDQVPVDDVT